MGFLDRFRPAARPPNDFLERMYLIPTTEAVGLGEGWHVTDGTEEIPLRLVVDRDGEVILPAFSSEERLSDWLVEGSTYIGFEGTVLLQMLIENEWARIVVDTTSPHAFAIEPPEARAMLGTTSLSIPEGARVAIGEIDVPDEFRQAVRQACADEATVLEAYVYGFALIEGDEKPRPSRTVGLHLQPGAEGEAVARTFQCVGDALDPAAWGLPFIDFQHLEGEKLEWVRKTTSPVFTRVP